MKIAIITLALIAAASAAYAGGGVILLLGNTQGGSAPSCSNRLDFSNSCNSYYIPNRS